MAVIASHGTLAFAPSRELAIGAGVKTVAA
jgi:hypothetical protein